MRHQLCQNGARSFSNYLLNEKFDESEAVVASKEKLTGNGVKEPRKPLERLTRHKKRIGCKDLL